MKTQTNQTPPTVGPWSCVSSLGLIRQEATGKLVCALPHALKANAIRTRRNGDDAEITPDARLIAAAPELLEALKLAARRAESENYAWPMKDEGNVEHQSLLNALAQYRAAIAKAEGAQ